MAVRSEFRGQGIGKACSQGSWRRAKVGGSAAFLELRAGNPLLSRFMKRLVLSGRETAELLLGSVEDAVTMTAELKGGA